MPEQYSHGSYQTVSYFKVPARRGATIRVGRVMIRNPGAQAVRVAAATRPQVIVLDLHLPDLHGEQVLSELKSAPATAAIPVVVLSADASDGVIHRLLASGAFAYLTKPIELAELDGLLDNLAAAQAQGRQAQPAARVTPQ